jgi:hypothetical protein
LGTKRPHQALAEVTQDEVGEGGRLALAQRASALAKVRLVKPEEQLADHRLGEPVGIHLVRVCGEELIGVDARLALDLDERAGQQGIDELLHAGIAQVQPVAGVIEGEGARVGLAQLALAQPAGAVALLDDVEAALEVVGGGESRQPRPEDQRLDMGHGLRLLA